MPELSGEAKGQWRPMVPSDLPQVLAVAKEVHPAFPEDAEVFAERLRLYAAGCLVFHVGRAIAGYVISHPWRAMDPPALNSRIGELPGRPETYYIHDFALLSGLRGTGAASSAVALMLARAGNEKLATVSLVAVNDSAEFWMRHGFRAIPLDEIGDVTLMRKLHGYSKAAAFMVRQLYAAGGLSMTESSERIVDLYERHARAFDRERGRSLFERGWLDRFRMVAGAGAAMLDVGCGSGEPIARYLIAAGHTVAGIDSAETMIAICRKRFPEQSWVVADMRGLALGRRFGGILAWDSFFHLTQADQRGMFAIFAAHAAEGCALMFTSGPRAGEAIGSYQNEALYHASLDPEEYRALLRANGFDVVDHVAEDAACGGHTIWLARSAGSGRADC